MLEHLQFLLRSCAMCSGFPIFRNTRLCSRCWGKVTEYFYSTSGLTTIAGGTVRFGFAWSTMSDGESKARLLHALKGKSCEASWRGLAEEFLIQHFDAIHRYRWVIIPAPPAKPGKIDHAKRWAESLTESISGNAADLLMRTEGLREQKELGRIDRRDIQIGLIDESSRAWLKSRIRDGWRVAFVDDVVTTGATATAAWIALGRPRPFEVWALSYRLFANHEGLNRGVP